MGMGVQLSLWRWGPHLKIRMLWAEVLKKPRGNFLTIVYLRLRVFAKGLGPSGIPAQDRGSNRIRWNLPSNREQSERRLPGIGSLLRRGAQLQVWSLPWPAQHGAQGALHEDLRTSPTTRVTLPLAQLRSRDLSSANESVCL